MKRVPIILTLLFTSLIIFASCTSPAANLNTADDKLTIVTTIFPQYDFAREIAGDKANISMLLPPGMESHSYEPTPQDIIKIQESDLFIYVGGLSDNWVERILGSLDTPIDTLALMDSVNLVQEEIIVGMEHDHHHDETTHNESIYGYDEHVWTSPQNALLIVEDITKILCEKDPENANYYQENAQSYQEKLSKLDQSIQDVVNNASRNTIIFGDRFPFRYFAEAYGLSYYAAFPGCANETEPSAATIAFLIDKVKDENIPVVFHIEFSNQKMADTICEGSTAKKRLFHSCHNVNKEDYQNGTSYLSLMTENLQVLEEALN